MALKSLAVLATNMINKKCSCGHTE